MSEEKDPHAPEALDAARAILNRMREAALSRGEARIDAAKAAKFEENAAARKAKRRASSAPAKYSDGRDPQEIGNLFGKIVRDRGWSAPVAVGSVLSRWSELVGPQIAAHCIPESFEDSTVVVRCDSTTWATQMRLLSHELLKHFDRELGPGVITVIRVLGPAAPSWRHGGRSVKGRGPRDTYG
ncbi:MULTISPECIES: DUF721 domain-containing protein [Paeniglutamicibacter]|jgi:predicted nucleic acid-binding Zn ribbon protein|uniref:Nucleic acid-binding Zn ribbon protein n=1 Tax=Paeniglutamicibacter sulfureus TaxID=43666 RepID=A0ABU2BK97_9MICC|nr:MULTISPECIES: DciA family protein [Paeniglutamicibacter]MCV9995777.1 DciA family protein [Paeniglutamicibacter sp. ZC-3]MDO2933966.1 DciA family protein [Paeniglutamicibacter sulfureus]MDR7358409.1 putative nucleic acid-binding Zn ribbon protein [Paeniglutamicibacter sulfureus]